MRLRNSARSASGKFTRNGRISAVPLPACGAPSVRVSVIASVMASNLLEKARRPSWPPATVAAEAPAKRRRSRSGILVTERDELFRLPCDDTRSTRAGRLDDGVGRYLRIGRRHARGRALLNGLDRHREPVARAALGPDIARPGPVRFDLAPQPADLHVDGAVEDLVVVQARKVQQLVSGENTLRRCKQRHEQAELAVGERDLATVGRGETTRAQVELPAVEAVGANSLGPRLARLGPAAAQHGPDAREQLARAAGLGEVIVGGDLESDHAVGLVLAASEDDDRQARLLA